MAPQLENVAEQQNASLEQFVSGYRPLPGIFDEMMDGDGRVRAHWQPFLAMLAALGGDEINRRFAAADRYLRDSGVFYRVYEDAAGIERPWPLSHVPLIIEPAEWRQLEAGVIQRAELLDAVLTDAYGPALLTSEGRLPAALIAGNPEFLRPLVGVAAPAGAHLRFYAVDVGRGADGHWWVLNDRAQAPSGAGYVSREPTRALASDSRYLSHRACRTCCALLPGFSGRAFVAQPPGRCPHCLLTPGRSTNLFRAHLSPAVSGCCSLRGRNWWGTMRARPHGSGLRRPKSRAAVDPFADPLRADAASRLGVSRLLQAVRDDRDRHR